jgi:hypothetical protein
MMLYFTVGYSQIRAVIHGPDSLCVSQNAEYFVNVDKYPNRYLLCDSINAGTLDAGYAAGDITSSFTYDFRIKPLKAIDLKNEVCGSLFDARVSLSGTDQNWAIVPAVNSMGYLGTGVTVGTNGVMVAERCGNTIVSRLTYPATISEWSHIAVVYTTDSLVLYINGDRVRAKGISADAVRCISPLLTGGCGKGDFAGGFDEFRVWDFPLQAEEISLVKDAKLLGHVSGLRYYAGFDTGDYTRTSGDLGEQVMVTPGYLKSQLKYSSWDLDSYSGPSVKNLTVFDIHNISYLWSTGSNNASIAYTPLEGRNTIYVKIYNPVLSKNALFSVIDSIAITGTLCAVTPTEGLVAYYPFNGTAKDESVFRNDGIITGAEPTADMYGAANGALYFDGEKDFIRINGALPVADYLTLSFIALSQNGSGYSNILNDGGSGLGGNSFNLDFQGNDIGISANKNATLNYDETTVAELQNLDLQNNWVHVVWVMSPEYSKIYVNGTLKTTIYESGSNTGFHNELSYIGARQGSDAPENLFRGKLDELKIYNRELADDEVQSLYQAYNFQNMRGLHNVTFNEIPDANILIYPNPVTDYVVVETTNFTDYEEDQVRIFNLSGNIVYSTTISAYRNQINLPDLKGQGVFIIQVSSPTGVVKTSKKIIFQ